MRLSAIKSEEGRECAVEKVKTCCKYLAVVDVESAGGLGSMDVEGTRWLFEFAIKVAP